MTQQAILNDGRSLLRWKGWIVFGTWAVALSLCTTIGVVLYIIVNVDVRPSTTAVILATATTTALVLLHVATLISFGVLRFILRRECKFNQLRFDVYQAVEETLGKILHQHLPQFKGLTTQLDVGEELVAAVEAVSRRRAALHAALSPAIQSGQLAQAVDTLVREALHHADLKGDVKELAQIHAALTSDRVVTSFPAHQATE